MFGALFKSDKAPFILSLTLSILAWLITTAIGNLSDVVILGVDTKRNSEHVTFVVQNHSIGKSLSDAVISFTCLTGDCLEPLTNNTYAEQQSVAPYSIQGNKICSSSARNFVAILSLPPTAQARFKTKLKADALPIFGFSGRLAEGVRGCPNSGSELKVENVRIIEGWSLLLLLVDYYYYFLVGSILVTLIFFIILLSQRAQTTVETKNGGGTANAAKSQHT